jgi:hypothetical protein
MEDSMRKLLLCGALIASMMVALVIQLPAAAPKGGEPTSYLLIYQTHEYNSKLGDSVGYFFNQILKTTDMLTLFSPVRLYGYSPKTLQSQPMKALVKRTKDVLKKDTNIGAANYRNIENNMMEIVKQIAEFMGTSTGGGMSGRTGGGNEIKSLLTQYKNLVENYRGQRKLNTNLFVQLSQKLKTQKGRKFIYVVLQKTFRVIPDRDTMEALRETPAFAFLASEAFYEESTKDFLNTEQVSNALKDAGVIFNFIYVKTQKRRRPGFEFKELSGDIYNVLSKVAKASGGTVITTNKPTAAFKKMAAAK